jgi:hypothetical protein
VEKPRASKGRTRSVMPAPPRRAQSPGTSCPARAIHPRARRPG